MLGKVSGRIHWVQSFIKIKGSGIRSKMSNVKVQMTKIQLTGIRSKMSNVKAQMAKIQLTVVRDQK